MASLSQAALWLVNQGAQAAFGEEQTRVWLTGENLVPINEYRRIVILVVGDFSMDARKIIASNMEKQAENAGFRLLKVQPVGQEIDFFEAPAYLYTGYVASDVWPKTANELSSALSGARVTFDSIPVSLVEASSLDALWVSAEAREELQDVEVTHGLQINYWPILGATALIVSAGFLLHTILTKAFTRARA